MPFVLFSGTQINSELRPVREKVGKYVSLCESFSFSWCCSLHVLGFVHIHYFSFTLVINRLSFTKPESRREIWRRHSDGRFQDAATISATISMKKGFNRYRHWYRPSHRPTGITILMEVPMSDVYPRSDVKILEYIPRPTTRHNRDNRFLHMYQ